MFKVGDLVTRISHSNDVVFKIEKIIDDKAYLKGVNVRLCADSDISDLVLVTAKETTEDREFYNLDHIWKDAEVVSRESLN